MFTITAARPPSPPVGHCDGQRTANGPQKGGKPHRKANLYLSPRLKWRHCQRWDAGGCSTYNRYGTNMPGDEAAAVATLDAFFERSTDDVAAGT